MITYIKYVMIYAEGSQIVSVDCLSSSSAIDHIQSETGNSSTGGQMRAFGPTIPFPFGLVSGVPATKKCFSIKS